MTDNQNRSRFACALLCGLALIGASSAQAEKARIGFQRTALQGPVYVAADKGYFAAEGVEPEFVLFDGAEPIAVAIVSGDIDFGITGLTAAFYNLAGKGALKIVAGYASEAPGFHSQAVAVSNKAWEAGFKSFADMKGRSFGVTQFGSTYHYSLGLLAEKYHVDLASIRIVALQSIPNIASALTGGTIEAGLLTAPAAVPMFEKGDAKLLGWTGDEVPWQPGIVITSSKTADTRGELVKHFLRVFKRGARDFYDAFTGPDGTRKDMPGAKEDLAILAKRMNQSEDQVRGAILHVEPEARLDVKDVLHQIAWYKAQGFIKSDVSGDDIIDKRYVVPLP